MTQMLLPMVTHILTRWQVWSDGSQGSHHKISTPPFSAWRFPLYGTRTILSRPKRTTPKGTPKVVYWNIWAMSPRPPVSTQCARSAISLFYRKYRDPFLSLSLGVNQHHGLSLTEDASSQGEGCLRETKWANWDS
jgi:hypothetical protein